MEDVTLFSYLPFRWELLHVRYHQNWEALMLQILRSYLVFSLEKSNTSYYLSSLDSDLDNVYYFRTGFFDTFIFSNDFSKFQRNWHRKIQLWNLLSSTLVLLLIVQTRIIVQGGNFNNLKWSLKVKGTLIVVKSTEKSLKT